MDTIISYFRGLYIADNLENQLKTLQSPFTWDIEEELVNSVPDDFVERLKEKQTELKCEEWPTVFFQKFALHLTICYMHWRKGEFPSAFESQQNCEELMREWGHVPVLQGLKHLSSSVFAYLKYQSTDTSDCYAVMSTIVPYANLDDKNKACVNGIRAWVLFQFGYGSKTQCAKYITAALELDPSCAEWHFLHGKFLMRNRKVETPFDLLDIKEIQEFEKAAEMSNCAAYDVILAHTYQTAAHKVLMNNVNLSLRDKIIHDFSENAVTYYRKALNKAPNSFNINVRCAEGFLNFYRPYQDREFGRKCLDTAQIFAPNNALVHHISAKYYEKDGEMEKAKMSYNLAGQLGTFGAFMDLSRVEFVTNEDYDPLPLMFAVYHTFKARHQRNEVVSQLISYYYRKKNNLKEAVSWLLKLDDEKAVGKLKKFKAHCDTRKVPCDILGEIIKKARLILKTENLSSEERSLYTVFLSKYERFEKVMHGQ